MQAFEDNLRRTRSKSSVAAYMGDVERFAAWFQDEQAESPDPATLTYIDVAAYRQHLLDRGLSAATVNRALNALQQWMRWAGNDDANHVRLVRQAQRLAPKSLGRKAFSALLRAARRGRHSQRNVALIQLMAQAGLRVGEVASLKMGDLEISERKGCVRVVGKRTKEREVCLNRAVRKSLSAWLEVRNGAQVDSVFVSQRGGKLAVRSIQYAVSSLMQEAGVEGSAHSLRHTFAANYLESNPSDLAGLSHLLGHDNLSTTLIYLQPTRADLAQRVERLPIAG